jgi:hypothetical protein
MAWLYRDSINCFYVVLGARVVIYAAYRAEFKRAQRYFTVIRTIGADLWEPKLQMKLPANRFVRRNRCRA